MSFTTETGGNGCLFDYVVNNIRENSHNPSHIRM